MAHLLEHMLFKGTPRHRNVPQELTEHGADPNGTTWFDRTNYFETFAATDSNLAWALDLEADRMIHGYVARRISRPNSPWCGTSSSWVRTIRAAFSKNGRCPPPTSGTTTGTRRLGPVPISSRCPSSGCRLLLSSTTSLTTHCWSWLGNSTKRDPASHHREVWRHPEAQARMAT